jgi:DnaJ-class molecular chaperone
MAANLPTDAVDCVTCKGAGLIAGRPCDACEGKGSLLVAAPAIACPRCKGTGKASERDSLSLSKHCTVCLGTGWARIIWDEPN